MVPGQAKFIFEKKSNKVGQKNIKKKFQKRKEKWQKLKLTILEKRIKNEGKRVEIIEGAGCRKTGKKSLNFFFK